MNEIIYPTIDLFLYDLRNGLGENQDEINRNRAYFQKKLPESLHQSLFQKDSYFEDEYVELLTKPNFFETSSKPYPFQGYYYPVRLGDTYGLLLDCSVNNQTEPQPAECFKELKAEIERRLNGQTATIGQTWMVSGWLPQSEAKSPEDIAKTCYKALMPDSKWEQDLEGKGQFLGATIFELSRYRLVMPEKTTSLATIQSIQENQHVIIILYPDRATAEKSARFYSDWLRLFEYRHKILWAYGQSRLLKQTIKNYFTTIEEDRQSINPNQSQEREFEKFRQTLIRVQNTLNNYTIDLNRLDFQNRTIDINLSNYKKRLERIEEKAENKLEFLEKFAKLVTDKYQLQITKDSENLERGMKLLENTISAVRSRVEVAKAERDRNFQDVIAILGVGWSVASFLPSPDKLGENANDPVRIFLTQSPLPPTWIKPAIPLVYKVSVAIVAAALAWLLIRLWPGLVKLIPLISKKK
jgi:hypothetical protein